jgi:hypothetical protein
MIQFYKPNPKTTGSACSFWHNKDGSIMASLIKQDSWNDAKKTGSFSKNKDNPKGRVIVKLNRVEVAGIIDSLESNREFSVFHNSEKQTLQIKFGPYLDKQTQVQKGFSFSVNKQDKEDSTNKLGFIIGFTFPEGRLLKSDLELMLNETFTRIERKAVPDRQQQQEKIENKPTQANNEDDSW